MSTHSVSHYSANRCVKYTLIFQFSVTDFPSFGLSRHNYYSRFTWYDFVACDKLTTGQRHDLGPFTCMTFSLTKLNLQEFAPGFRLNLFYTFSKSDFMSIIQQHLHHHLTQENITFIPYSVEICHKICRLLWISATIVTVF